MAPPLVGTARPAREAPEVEGADRPTQGKPLPAPELAYLAEELSAWPELPEVPPVEPADTSEALREWERLARLEREQRGE